MEGLIAVTYRCNAHCHMCNTWQFPTSVEEEVAAADLRSLPHLTFANITGGEPFLRGDHEEIVKVVRSKSDRVVISTNGYFTDRVVALAEKYPDLGFRVCLGGLPAANDELRAIKDGFDRGLRALVRLRLLGVKDIGFGITVSDRNADDLAEVCELADAMGPEFATAAVHNNYHFHKFDSVIEQKERVAERLKGIARRLLRTNRPKSWFRAWFNVGLAKYVRGGARLRPCEMGTDVFFVDPFGRVMPCNAMEAPMGSLKDQTCDEIWASPQAKAARERVNSCHTNCWMIGSVAPVMKKHPRVPATWVLKAKLAGQLSPIVGLRAHTRR